MNYYALDSVGYFATFEKAPAFLLVLFSVIFVGIGMYRSSIGLLVSNP